MLKINMWLRKEVKNIKLVGSTLNYSRKIFIFKIVWKRRCGEEREDVKSFVGREDGKEREDGKDIERERKGK